MAACLSYSVSLEEAVAFTRMDGPHQVQQLESVVGRAHQAHAGAALRSVNKKARGSLRGVQVADKRHSFVNI